jgi:uncharacterized flavoprotein (TIGR03862 family)
MSSSLPRGAAPFILPRMSLPTPQSAILGAGPAGLMAAEILAREGCRVTIYDQMPSPARKLLIAGRGGLNLTHSEPLAQFLTRYGASAEWLAPSIHAFPPEALRAWCEGLGEETFVGSSGRVFPRSMKAAPLLRAWLRRLETLGVVYAPRHQWQGWESGALRFAHAGEARWITPDATLLALGGASWPRLGSDGKWTAFLTAAGVELAPLTPSNMGCVVAWSDYFRNRFAGTPLKPVAITHAGVTRQGEAVITARGLEGGVIYACSAALRDAVAATGYARVTLDLRPAMTEEALRQKLGDGRGSKSLSSYLKSAGFSPLAVALLHEVIAPARLKQASTAELASWLKVMPLSVTATEGITRAISSAGGIRREALTDGFMLRNMPGVFAAGEMLDWEAPTGGYLLQACFSTAVAAAKNMLHYLSR